MNARKPTPGLEPGTPSLRENSRHQRQPARTPLTPLPMRFRGHPGQGKPRSSEDRLPPRSGTDWTPAHPRSAAGRPAEVMVVCASRRGRNRLGALRPPGARPAPPESRAYGFSLRRRSSSGRLGPLRLIRGSRLRASMPLPPPTAEDTSTQGSPCAARGATNILDAAAPERRGAVGALVSLTFPALWGAKNRVSPANPHFSETRTEFCHPAGAGLGAARKTSPGGDGQVSVASQYLRRLSLVL